MGLREDAAKAHGNAESEEMRQRDLALVQTRQELEEAFNEWCERLHVVGAQLVVTSEEAKPNPMPGENPIICVITCYTDIDETRFETAFSNRGYPLAMNIYSSDRNSATRIDSLEDLGKYFAQEDRR